MYVTNRSYHSTDEGLYGRQSTLERHGTITSNSSKKGMSYYF